MSTTGVDSFLSSFGHNLNPGSSSSAAIIFSHRTRGYGRGSKDQVVYFFNLRFLFKTVTIEFLKARYPV